MADYSVKLILEGDEEVTIMCPSGHAGNFISKCDCAVLGNSTLTSPK